MTTTTTITMTTTGSPSRSKGSGWARIGSGDEAVFASSSGRKVEVEGPFDLVLGVTLRRATRTSKERDVYHLVPAEGQSVELSIGSPQSYDVRVDGATFAPES